jgi:hypothetical protein
MPSVIQARCPKCQHTLRIPADWLGRSMRCKHCQEVFTAQTKATTEAVPAGIAVAHRPAATAATGHRPVRNNPGDPFAFIDEPGTPAPLPQRKNRGRGWWKGLVLLACVASVAVGVFFLTRPYLGGLFRERQKHIEHIVGVNSDSDHEKKTPTANTHEDHGNPERIPDNGPKQFSDPGPAPKKEGSKTPSSSSRLFPRRALLINVNSYLFANHVEYGSPRDGRYPGSSTMVLADQMTRRPLNMPATQITELSDGARKSHPTLKPVIETTITDFLNTCRAQDRILILFAGHAAEIDNQGYLVPLEGDLQDAKTLIPLKWVYEQMARCPAWQKVLVLDVFRFSPVRGLELPGSGAMTAEFDNQLKNPPKGVQVWTSCIKDQKAIEFEKGSVFLQSLCSALQDRWMGIQDQANALPMEQLCERVNQRMKALLEPENLEQTSRLAGQSPGSTGPYDPMESMPDTLVVREPQPPTGKSAPRGQVNAILGEIKEIPQVRAMSRRRQNLLTIAYLPPFSAMSLRDYLADEPSFRELEKMLKTNRGELADLKQTYPLRIAVIEAIKALNDNAKFVMKESLTNPGGPITAQIKNRFLQDQKEPGMAIFELKRELTRLQAAGKNRGKEASKRWQAHYDYTLTRLMSRLVYTYEYSFMLGKVRGDDLPKLNPNIHNGWRLAAREKVQIQAKEPEVKSLVKSIGRQWKKIAQDYPGTPWALLARRESMTALGLEWRPSRD